MIKIMHYVRLVQCLEMVKKMMPGLSNRSGHRNHVIGRNNEGWGGGRIKNVLEKLGDGFIQIQNMQTASVLKKLIYQLINEALQDEETSDNERASEDDNEIVHF